MDEGRARVYTRVRAAGLALVASGLVACSQEMPKSEKKDATHEAITFVTTSPTVISDPAPRRSGGKLPDRDVAREDRPLSPDQRPVASASGFAPAIPEALQGRWALGPADCDEASGAAKGLMIVGADTLRFYESRGKLATIMGSSPTSLTATFAMTGEGMTWTRRQRFTLTPAGKLVRREYGKDAIPGDLTYARC